MYILSHSFASVISIYPRINRGTLQLKKIHSVRSEPDLMTESASRRTNPLNIGRSSMPTAFRVLLRLAVNHRNQRRNTPRGNDPQDTAESPHPYETEQKHRFSRKTVRCRRRMLRPAGSREPSCSRTIPFLFSENTINGKTDHFLLIFS